MTGLPTTRDATVGVDVIVAPDHLLRRCRTVRRAASGLAAVLTAGLVSYGVIANRTVEGIPEPARAPLVSATGPRASGTRLPDVIRSAQAPDPLKQPFGSGLRRTARVITSLSYTDANSKGDASPGVAVVSEFSTGRLAD